MRKMAVILCILLYSIPVFAEDARQDAWICPNFETYVYSPNSLSYGAGLTAAYGSGATLGLKAVYIYNGEEAPDVLEISCLFRLYLLKLRSGGANYGPWFQFNGGPALYMRTHIIDGDHEWGDISAGMSLGWRFLLGELFFIEPYVKGGYPFLFGGGLATGLRF